MTSLATLLNSPDTAGVWNVDPERSTIAFTTRSFWVLLLSNMPMGKVTAASRASPTPRREAPSAAAMRPTRKTEPAPASHCRRLSSRSRPSCSTTLAERAGQLR